MILSSSEGMWMQTVSMGLGFRFRVHLIQIHILHILFPLLSLNPKPIRTRCKPEQSQWQPSFSKSARTVKVSSCLNQTHEWNAWNRKYRVPCVCCKLLFHITNLSKKTGWILPFLTPQRSLSPTIFHVHLGRVLVTYLLCYKDLSKTFSGSSVGGATADMGLSRNGLREWENKLASTFAFCLALTFPVEFRYSARIPGWNLSKRVTTPSLSRSLQSLASFKADGAFSILTH